MSSPADLTSHVPFSRLASGVPLAQGKNADGAACPALLLATTNEEVVVAVGTNPVLLFPGESSLSRCAFGAQGQPHCAWGCGLAGAGGGWEA